MQSTPIEHGDAEQTIAKLLAFIDAEIVPFERQNGMGWESTPSKALLQQVWRRSAECGFYGLMLPRQQGGAGYGAHDMCRIKAAAAASGAVLAMHVLGDLSGPPRVGYLFRVASAWQIERFLKPICRAEQAVCFAITEEGAGSDAGALQCRALRDGDHYVLSGHKRFISGAPYADMAIVLASTDPDQGAHGISAFFVDLHAPGVSVSCDYTAMYGQSSHADLHLDGVRVASANRIGAEGQGFKLGLGRINLNRLLHCATLVGYGELALRLTLAYAQSRRQFGQAIAEFQAIQHLLANMGSDLYAAQAMMLNAAQRLDDGSDLRLEASMCKLFVSERMFALADAALQIHGGIGLMRGHPVQWVFNLTRMMRVLTGTSEILRNTVGKELLGRGHGA